MSTTCSARVGGWLTNTAASALLGLIVGAIVVYGSSACRRAARPWSCDSFVVTPAASACRSMLLGKNSDRPVNETQPLRYFPARRPGGHRLQLAGVEIAGEGETLAHVGASPYWCWGHELGLNERGVAIGNEALFTRDLARNRLGPARVTRPSPGSSGWSCCGSGSSAGTRPQRRSR